jgi:hypothetical protein
MSNLTAKVHLFIRSLKLYSTLYESKGLEYNDVSSISRRRGDFFIKSNQTEA